MAYKTCSEWLAETVAILQSDAEMSGDRDALTARLENIQASPFYQNCKENQRAKSFVKIICICFILTLGCIS